MIGNKNSYFSPVLVSLEINCLVLISLAIFPHHYIDNFFQIAKSYGNTTISGETTKAISVRMWVEHDPITRGQIQTVNFNVTDNETGKPIHGANIDGYTIYNPQPHRINLHIVTNDSGKASYSWKVPHDTIPGLFITSAKISAEGYAYDDFKEITFEVK